MLPPAATADQQYTVHDYECEEFTKLVTLNTHQQSLFEQMKSLFALLDRHWDGNFARYRVTQVSAAAAADMTAVMMMMMMMMMVMIRLCVLFERKSNICYFLKCYLYIC